MADISLDLADRTSPTYKDLLVASGDLVMTSDVNESLGTNPVLQDILQTLSFMLGEWFLDNTKGIPWFQQILVKNPNEPAIDAIIQNAILSVPGVLQLTQYSFSVNALARVLTISFRVITTSGVVVFNGAVGNDNIITEAGDIIVTEGGDPIVIE